MGKTKEKPDNKLKIYCVLNFIFWIEILIGLVLLFVDYVFCSNNNWMLFAITAPSVEIILMSSLIFFMIDVPTFIVVLISNIFKKKIKRVLVSLLILILTNCLLFIYMAYFIMTTGGV